MIAKKRKSNTSLSLHAQNWQAGTGQSPPGSWVLFSGSGEPDINQFGSHPNHENRSLHEGHPASGPLIGTGSREYFFDSHRSAAGAPLRGRRHSSYQMDRVVTIPASYLNTTIFIGNAQKQVFVTLLGLLHLPAPPPLSHPPLCDFHGTRWENKQMK